MHSPKPHTKIPTPEEAREILCRYNRSHFNLDGEKARYSIPVRHDHDDDVMLAAFIDAAEEDKKRLDYLEELIRHCPHAEFFFSDDDADEKPLGFSIEVSGCETSLSVGKTLREAIDKDIAHQAYKDEQDDPFPGEPL